MIQQLFATMHETLDRLIVSYPQAAEEEKKAFQEQWEVLKTLSDDIIELWLQFETKLGTFRKVKQQQTFTIPSCQRTVASFIKAQGYFRLFMFDIAAVHLQDTVRNCADFVYARLFLAISLMHLNRWQEAQQHLQVVIQATKEKRIQAISFNALGCVQAVFNRLDKARDYFKQAIHLDPAFPEPKKNLQSLNKGKDKLQLQFGSEEFQHFVQA